MTKPTIQNPYTAPSELAVSGQVNLHHTAIVVAFDDVRYSLSTGPLNGGLHHIMLSAIKTCRFCRNGKGIARWFRGRLFERRIRAGRLSLKLLHRSHYQRYHGVSCVCQSNSR